MNLILATHTIPLKRSTLLIASIFYNVEANNVDCEKWNSQKSFRPKMYKCTLRTKALTSVLPPNICSDLAITTSTSTCYTRILRCCNGHSRDRLGTRFVHPAQRPFSISLLQPLFSIPELSLYFNQMYFSFHRFLMCMKGLYQADFILSNIK